MANGRSDRTHPDYVGTKTAVDFHATVPAGGTMAVQVRLSVAELAEPFADFDPIFAQRLAEANEFYAAIQQPTRSEDAKNIQRQAFAGLLWSKQFYHYGVELWLDGDPASPKPPAARKNGRNASWLHLDNRENGRFTATSPSSKATPIGATTSSSTNTSTVTTAPVSVPATKPAGLPLLPSY